MLHHYNFPEGYEEEEIAEVLGESITTHLESTQR
jgi:hypothetical protein